MRENGLRKLWQAGGAAVNGWLAINSSFSAEVMAHAGWDSLTIDLQHGPLDYSHALPMLQAISTTSVTPMARVPWNEPGIIMKLLDAGAMGIICPMINTREQAEAFVGACRYSPEGFRSFGPTRAVLYAGNDYAAHANSSIITMAMIETGEAYENLESILTTPGLDAIYVGPSDLSLSMTGRAGSDHTEPPMYDVVMAIKDAAQRHGVVTGIHTGDPAYSARMIGEGFQFVTVGSDSRLLTMASQQVLATARGGVAAQAKSGSGPY
jgi:4-hydroxy-2-oxoheptanedioate aldolase